MGPPWMKGCIQVFIPLDNVRPECALQVGVGSQQVGQRESNRWDVCSMDLGDIPLLKGCTFHRGAGGGEKGCYTLFILFVPFEHAAYHVKGALGSPIVCSSSYGSISERCQRCSYSLGIFYPFFGSVACLATVSYTLLW